jgi:hypothetical protein
MAVPLFLIGPLATATGYTALFSPFAVSWQTLHVA